MKSPKSIVYTSVGLTLFVVLPFFIIASLHFEKAFGGNDYVVTNISGSAAVKYKVRYSLGEQSEAYRNKSQWIPLMEGSKIAIGASVKTENGAFLDIMREDNVDAAFRISEKSLVKLTQGRSKHGFFNVALGRGKLLCRVPGGHGTASSEGDGKYEITTPTATVFVKGTTFSVNYLPSEKITQVAVLDGSVNLQPKNPSIAGADVCKGQGLRVAPSYRRPILENISPELQAELEVARKLKLKKSFSDRCDRLVNLAMESPLYRKALSVITKYEMKVFSDAIIQFAGLHWNGTVPDSLKSVDLVSGDYKDPWDTEYYYEKIESKKAVLISAGPDRTFHTPDDAFMFIRL
ncbi:MAG: FecR family protein [Thermodesulfobacteriota bacterium]|nr:FecR family protein [Thermodesulfobacteriota bacterium]